LCNRETFLKLLQVEIERSRSHRSSLALCFMKIDFEDDPGGSGSPAKERIINFLGDSFAKQIRAWDTLSRYGRKTFALLMPQISIQEAESLCNRLQRISEGCRLETGGSRIKLAFGLTELALDKDEDGPDLIDRATAFLQNVSCSRS
jgi:PleD family two-component response regulator